MTEKTGLEQALLEAQEEITTVVKDKSNEFHKYAYVSSEAIMRAARDALHAAGLYVTRDEWAVVKPETLIDAYVKCAFTLHHPASGEVRTNVISWPVVPDRGRPMDKALAAALTTAQSYWLRDILQIPRVDEEMDARDDSGYQPTPPPKGKPKPAEKPSEAVITPPQVLRLSTLLQEADLPAEKFCNGFGIKTLGQLPAAKYVEAETRIAKYMQRKEAGDE